MVALKVLKSSYVLGVTGGARPDLRIALVDVLLPTATAEHNDAFATGQMGRAEVVNELCCGSRPKERSPALAPGP